MLCMITPKNKSTPLMAWNGGANLLWTLKIRAKNSKKDLQEIYFACHACINYNLHCCIKDWAFKINKMNCFQTYPIGSMPNSHI